MPRHEPCADSVLALSDLDLVQSVRAGDHAAFSVLYERYFERVHNFAYARLRNRADAEEVAQETFVSVFRSLDSFQGRSSLLSWIYGITKNTVNNYIRKNRAQEQRIEKAQDELTRNAQTFESCSPEEHERFRRCAAAAVRSLEDISEWQVEVFAMRHFENVPIQEIADRMSRSNDAIRSSLYRVKKLVVEAVETEQAQGF